MERLTPRQQKSLICVLLGAITVLVFWPVTTHEFISYDDAIYITGNAHVKKGLVWDNVAWAFTAGDGGNWHPLTWFSHMLDAQLFGLHAGWHHLISAIIHAINAILLFLLLDRLTRAIWRSAVVAALFALHPLHVQSVAWAAERKDVLSAFFFMLTLLAYARYAMGNSAASPQEVPRSRFVRTLFYSLSLLFFALGLMSKPMLVTVPFVLLLLDYWPLGRLPSDLSSGRKVLIPIAIEKIPFLILAVGSCVVTLWAQKNSGAVVPVDVLPLGGRLANALNAYAEYLAQTVWPVNLALLYPFNEIPSASATVLSVVVLLAITAWVIWSFRRRPFLSVGWFWYLGMLVPVIGIVQVGMQQRADRYTYLPLIGIFIMGVWEVAERVGSSRQARIALLTSAAAILVACVAVTREQIGYWQDSERIFQRAAAVTPSNYIALNNYGVALLGKHKADEAIEVFQKAVEVRPNLDVARCGLGTALMERNQYAEAAKQFNRVLELDPDNATAQLQIGILFAREGNLSEAAKFLSRAAQLDPEDPGTQNNFANVLLLQGHYDEALKHFEEAVRAQPNFGIAYINVATCYKKLGRTADAIDSYQKAVQLLPDSYEALNNLASMLAMQPEARFRDGNQAVQLALRAGELTQYKNPTVLATIAAAFAETGQFQEAISYAELAQKLGAGNKPLEERVTEMLAAFRASHAYREQ